VHAVRPLALGLAALTLVASAAGAGCGDEPAPSRGADTAPAQPAGTDTAPAPRAPRGFSVTIPPGWHRADRPVTVLADPVEVLVAGTYPPEPGPEGRCGPLSFRGFDAAQVLVMVLERGQDPKSEWSDFPPRPAHFAFANGMSSEFTSCLRERSGIPLRDHWFRFTDAGRHFHVLVVIGADAPQEAETEAYRMLDSMRFDPSVKPDWRSAG
jgi:hypothetical protein